MNDKIEAVAFLTQPCPVCNACLFKHWRWNRLEACLGCGHVRKVLGTEKETTEKVQQAYFNSQFSVQNDVFTRFYERLNAQRRLKELRAVIPSGRVLEVGVGRGHLLFTLKSAGYNVEGIDISPDVCTAVQVRYELPVHCSTLEAYAESTPIGTYDGIIMCHIFEHIESPLSALRAVRRMLKKGGILYLAVPNLAAWNAYFPGWTGYEPYHVHYFGPATLRRVLESANFNVLHERTFEPISGWGNTVVRSVSRHSPKLEANVYDPHGSNYQKCFLRTFGNLLRIVAGMLLSPLRWLQSAGGYGEELVMIARRD